MKTHHALRLLSIVAILLAVLAGPAIASPQAGTCGTVNCGTQVSGLQFMTTWPITGSPYCVTGDITVADLTIDAGVEVCFCGNYEVIVLTGLTAVGAPDKPIVFKASAPGTRWKSIVFQNTPAGSSLVHCRIQDAQESGLSLFNSTPVIDHCVFTGNTNVAPSKYQGGALHAEVGNLDLAITNCLFENNTARRGGGLYCSMTNGKLLTLENCVVRNNTASLSFGVSTPGCGTCADFGGAHVVGNCLARNCLVEGNTALSSCNWNFCGSWSAGGGVGFDGTSSDVILENCILRGNTAQSICAGGACGALSRGGGLYLSAGTVLLSNTIVGCNVADSNTDRRGGGIYVASGAVDLRNCTIASNNIYGLENGGGSVTVDSSILYFNSPTPPTYGAQTAGMIATLQYSDVQNLPAPLPAGWTSDINVNPVFAGSGCANQDLTILSVSPCVDMGNPSSAFDDVRFPPSFGSNRNDIGAHGGPGAVQWRTTAQATPQAWSFCGSLDTQRTTGCPCGNNGAMDHGCGNSIYSSGAVLLARGSTSPETMVLGASSMPSATNSIFLKGDANNGMGVVFGDGVRCVDGFLIRLGTKFNLNGAANYPEAGNPSLSVKGQTPPGSGLTAYYQTYYRNSAATFCPPATFNVTNGVVITW